MNERFALFYPEKRPFFLEGIELFATPNQLVYTRQIVDPTGGGKLTGKVGKTGVAILSAADDTGDAHAWVTMARLRQDVGKDSLAGVTYTDRTESGGFNRVVAADARIVFKKLYYVLGQVGGSWTERDGDDRQRADVAGRVRPNRTALRLQLQADGLRRAFRNASRATCPRNNIVEGRASNRLTWYGARGDAVESFTRVPVASAASGTYADFGSAGADRRQRRR